MTRTLHLGERLAQQVLPSNRNPRFPLHTFGGRWVLACVALDLGRPEVSDAVTRLGADATPEGAKLKVLFCGDPAGAENSAVAGFASAGLVFFDGGRDGIDACGLGDEARMPGGRWLLLDPSLRVVGVWPIGQTEAALTAFAAAPDADQHAGVPLHAPVLIVPRVFEPAFCTRLIEYYETNGGRRSGTTRENADGQTYIDYNDDFKRRADCEIVDEKLRQAAMHRIFWRLLPEIEKSFVYRATRMERYIVACYDSESGGFFKPHRDNTTKGTAHRRFAVTINLDISRYEGGDLRFPEFGSRTYRAPSGGAVVFSCSLLHEATAVTSGKRYAFLPFLYDDEAAKVRAANNSFLDASIAQYRMGDE